MRNELSGALDSRYHIDNAGSITRTVFQHNRPLCSVSWIMNGEDSPEHRHKCVHIALHVTGKGVGSRSRSPLWKYWPISIGPVCVLACHHKCAPPVLFSSSSPGLRSGMGSLLTSGAGGLPDGPNSSHWLGPKRPLKPCLYFILAPQREPPQTDEEFILDALAVVLFL